MNHSGLLRRWSVIALAGVALAVSAQSATTIRCVGNSVTMTTQYPQKLQALLGSVNYRVTNDGVGGSGITGWSRRYITLNGVDQPERNFLDIFDAKPDIITIDLGINDTHNPSADNLHSIFVPDYNKLIDTFLTITPTPRLFLVLPTPQYAPEQQVWIDNNNNVICPIIDSLARARGFPLIDVHTPLLNHREWYPANDGCHISNTSPGADTIARIFYRAILAATAADAPRSYARMAGSVPSLLSNGKSLNVSVPGHVSWTLECLALDGKRIAVFSGAGSKSGISTRQFPGRNTVIAKLKILNAGQEKVTVIPIPY